MRAVDKKDALWDIFKSAKPWNPEKTEIRGRFAEIVIPCRIRNYAKNRGRNFEIQSTTPDLQGGTRKGCCKSL
jgi:hypothetical protein